MTLDTLGEGSGEQHQNVLPTQHFLWSESRYLAPGAVDESSISGYREELGHQLAGLPQGLCA